MPMSMVGPERRELIVSKTQQYKEAISPFVLPARAAFQRVVRIRETLGFTGGKPSKVELERFPVLREPQEKFRLKANELIAEVNKWRAQQAADAALVGRPQIPPAEGKNPFKKPESPVMPHNALGELSVYRKRHIRPDLVDAITAQTGEVPAGTSLAMVYLIPEHLVAMDSSAPSDIRKPADLASQIVGIAKTVAMYNAGLLQPPTAEELGKRSPEQDQYIIRHLRALLAYYLADEFANPNRTEAQFLSLYQGLSNNVREMSRFITPRDGRERGSYERVGSLIEQLPGLEGSMLASRLSTSLFQDLGLPCLDYMGEIRLAEVMRNIGYSGRFSPNNRADMTVGCYVLPEDRRLLFPKIIESIGERLETGEIDCQRLFEALEALDNGEQLMDKLLGIADDDQKGILLRALTESGCFPDVIRALRKKYDLIGDLR